MILPSKDNDPENSCIPYSNGLRSEEEAKIRLVDLILREYPKFTFAFKACLTNEDHCAKLLIRFKGERSVALLQACEEEDFESASWLIENNAKVNCIIEKMSLLSHLVLSDNYRGVKFLLKNKADPNICDIEVTNGEIKIHNGTPLHSAALYNRYKIARALIKANANIFAHCKAYLPFDQIRNRATPSNVASFLKVYLEQSSDEVSHVLKLERARQDALRKKKKQERKRLKKENKSSSISVKKTFKKAVRFN